MLVIGIIHRWGSINTLNGQVVNVSKTVEEERQLGSKHYCFLILVREEVEKKKICQNLARTKTQFYNTIIIEEKIYKSNYNIHIKTQTTKSSSLFYLVRLNLPNLITF